MHLFLQERRNQITFWYLCSPRNMPQKMCVESWSPAWSRFWIQRKMCLSGGWQWRKPWQSCGECGEIAKGQTSLCEWVLAPVKLWETCILRAKWCCIIIVPKLPRVVLMLCTSRVFLLFTCHSGFYFWFPGAYNVKIMNSWMVDWWLMHLWSC